MGSRLQPTTTKLVPYYHWNLPCPDTGERYGPKRSLIQEANVDTFKLGRKRQSIAWRPGGVVVTMVEQDHRRLLEPVTQDSPGIHGPSHRDDHGTTPG